MNYERLLRRLRCSPKLWEPDSIKIDRVLLAVKARMLRAREKQVGERSESVGPYSGLTRAELRQSGTCETDWF